MVCKGLGIRIWRLERILQEHLGSGFGELDCITEGLYGTVSFWRFARPEVFPDEEEEISIWGQAANSSRWSIVFSSV